MATKKVLIFIDWFQPGYKAGGPISSNVNLVDHLCGDFEFYVITRDTDYCEKTPYASVNSDQWNELPNGARVYYISAGKLSFRSLAMIAKKPDFDVVFVNGIYSLYFSIFPVIWFRHIQRKKVIVSARGMLSDHTFSSKKFKKKLFYGLAKFTGLYRGVSIHATNENEAFQIRKNVGFKGEILVAPNLPPMVNHQELTGKPKVPGELRLVSIARISPEKNTLFALEVLENLSKRIPEKTVPAPLLSLDLYGTIYDTSYWKLCEEIIARLPLNIRVTFCGPIEKTDIPNKLSTYHFLLMPSQGENYGHSIIESFLAGCPVIISDRTPWRGLNVVKSAQWREAEGGRQKAEGERQEAEGHGTWDTGHEARGRRQEAEGERDTRTETLGTGQETGVGWDIPLKEPEKFVEALETCIAMNQKTYDAMSRRAFEYAQEVSKDEKVIEANRRMLC